MATVYLVLIQKIDVNESTQDNEVAKFVTPWIASNTLGSTTTDHPWAVFNSIRVHKKVGLVIPEHPWPGYDQPSQTTILQAMRARVGTDKDNRIVIEAYSDWGGRMLGTIFLYECRLSQPLKSLASKKEYVIGFNVTGLVQKSGKEPWPK
jgi:hypothetical protein